MAKDWVFFQADAEPNNPYPDAWCISCENVKQAHGGEWPEESQTLTPIALVCGECYEEIKTRNIRSLRQSRKATRLVTNLGGNAVCSALPSVPSKITRLVGDIVITNVNPFWIRKEGLRLAITPRPRGYDWLVDDIRYESTVASGSTLASANCAQPLTWDEGSPGFQKSSFKGCQPFSLSFFEMQAIVPSAGYSTFIR